MSHDIHVKTDKTNENMPESLTGIQLSLIKTATSESPAGRLILPVIWRSKAKSLRSEVLIQAGGSASSGDSFCRSFFMPRETSTSGRRIVLK
jgi:hypothetical protein